MTINADKVLLAWNFASKAHTDQKYSTNTGYELPYLNHVGAVVNELFAFLINQQEEFDAELMIISAILHDVLEDTNHSFEELKNIFGEKIASGTLALTKNDQIEDKAEKLEDSLSRILQQPKEIAIVKMADRIVNLQKPPMHWSDSKIGEYLEESNAIYNALKPASPAMSERLKEKISIYHINIK